MAEKTIMQSPEKLAALLPLLAGAKTVELKLSVPDANRRSAVAALGMDALQAQIRQVVFFDTPDLRLNGHGVVVRARRVQDKPDDTVVKLRPVVPDQLPARLRDDPDLGIEVDAMPTGFVCSASLKGERPAGMVPDVLAGRTPVRRLFSKSQRAMYKTFAPEGLALDDLTPLGPITLLKLKFVPRELGARLVAELWFFPDGSRILELSTKCLPADTFRVAAETRVFLTGHGIDLGGEQQTKTKTALTLLSGELTAATG